MYILLIVAAGISSRFGGYPKAFCDIGNGNNNICNTIEKASSFFDKIYLGVNKKIHESYYRNIKNCEVITIETGQGDAHSLLKCLNIVKDREGLLIDKIAVCWGDAVFVNEVPFKCISETQANDEVVVACSCDSHPYAWFDVKDSYILKSHFSDQDGDVESGIHDQSLFVFNFEFALSYLDEYRLKLNIPNENKKIDVNEMKLLNSFNYLYETKKKPAKCLMIPKGFVKSFNTREELDIIKETLRSNNCKF